MAHDKFLSEDELVGLDWIELVKLRDEISGNIANLGPGSFARDKEWYRWNYERDLLLIDDAIRKLGDRAAVQVALEWWQHFNNEYKVRLYANAEGFFFTGERRGPRSVAHASFPEDRGVVFLVGDRDECAKFLKSELPKEGCPENILDKLLDKVERWTPRE